MTGAQTATDDEEVSVPNNKAAAAKTFPRCLRNDGRNWQCSGVREEGTKFCSKHNLQKVRYSGTPKSKKIPRRQQRNKQKTARDLLRKEGAVETEEQEGWRRKTRSSGSQFTTQKSGEGSKLEDAEREMTSAAGCSITDPSKANDELGINRDNAAGGCSADPSKEEDRFVGEKRENGNQSGKEKSEKGLENNVERVMNTNPSIEENELGGKNSRDNVGCGDPSNEANGLGMNRENGTGCSTDPPSKEADGLGENMANGNQLRTEGKSEESLQEQDVERVLDTYPSKEADGLGINRDNATGCCSTDPSSKEVDGLGEKGNGNQSMEKSEKGSDKEEDAERVRNVYPSKEADRLGMNMDNAGSADPSKEADGLGMNRDNTAGCTHPSKKIDGLGENMANGNQSTTEKSEKGPEEDVERVMVTVAGADVSQEEDDVLRKIRENDTQLALGKSEKASEKENVKMEKSSNAECGDSSNEDGSRKKRDNGSQPAIVKPKKRMKQEVAQKTKTTVGGADFSNEDELPKKNRDNGSQLLRVKSEEISKEEVVHEHYEGRKLRQPTKILTYNEQEDDDQSFGSQSQSSDEEELKPENGTKVTGKRIPGKKKKQESRGKSSRNQSLPNGVRKKAKASGVDDEDDPIPKVHSKVRNSLPHLLVYTDDQEVGPSISRMCHQCQRNDKGAVACCNNCGRKRYCYPCIRNW